MIIKQEVELILPFVVHNNDDDDDVFVFNSFSLYHFQSLKLHLFQPISLTHDLVDQHTAIR